MSKTFFGRWIARNREAYAREDLGMYEEKVARALGQPSRSHVRWAERRWLRRQPYKIGAGMIFNMLGLLGILLNPYCALLCVPGFIIIVMGASNPYDPT